jgi:hypothetical protein
VDLLDLPDLLEVVLEGHLQEADARLEGTLGLGEFGGPGAATWPAISSARGC